MVATPKVVALEESTTDEMFQSPEQPSTPVWRSQHVSRTPTPVELPTVLWPGALEVAPPDPPTRQVPPILNDPQISDQSPSPVRLSKSQKFKAKRVAKKQAREAQESGVRLARAEITIGAP